MLELRYSKTQSIKAINSRKYTPSGIAGVTTHRVGELMTEQDRLEYNRTGVRMFILDRRRRGIPADGTTPASVWS